MNDKTKQFISKHENDDLFTLKLHHKINQEVDIDVAIRQITGRQKIKLKVPLFYNTEGILYPVQLSLEQSSSESTAKYKSSLCEGDTLVDLTGGFGVDCCFMSERFNQVVYVERHAELCELAAHNFNTLNKKQIRVIHSETEKYLSEMKPVDWIFIDPARRGTSGNKVVLLSDCEPDVSALSTLLLEKATQVMIKLSPMMDITAALKNLPQTSEIHIISVENECKEVLLILSPHIPTNIKIKTINLGKKNQHQIFDFQHEDEHMADASCSSKIEKYLYEPNAAIMKSGAFKLVGTRFGLQKLHINTHLYTSTELIPDFPGRIFQVDKVWATSKKELKEQLKRVPKANISTRNYPLTVDELRNKLKIKDGGEVYLFACTVDDDHKVIIECQKVPYK